MCVSLTSGLNELFTKSAKYLWTDDAFAQVLKTIFLTQTRLALCNSVGTKYTLLFHSFLIFTVWVILLNLHILEIRLHDTLIFPNDIVPKVDITEINNIKTLALYIKNDCHQM